MSASSQCFRSRGTPSGGTKRLDYSIRTICVACWFIIDCCPYMILVCTFSSYPKQVHQVLGGPQGCTAAPPLRRAVSRL